MIKPLNNHCLIEVIDDSGGLYTGASDQNVQKGICKKYTLFEDHLTTSTGYQLSNIDNLNDFLKTIIGKVVYWQEYADAGAKFEIDGKQYVLVPFYRLIGVEE